MFRSDGMNVGGPLLRFPSGGYRYGGWAASLIDGQNRIADKLEIGAVFYFLLHLLDCGALERRMRHEDSAQAHLVRFAHQQQAVLGFEMASRQNEVIFENEL